MPNWPDDLRRREAEAAGEPDIAAATARQSAKLVDAVSPYLNRPQRSKERAALDAALSVVRWTAEHFDGTDAPLGTAARMALDHIKTLVPEAIKC